MAKAKKLPSGNWRVNLYVGINPTTGKRKYLSFTAATKKEAEYMAAEYRLKGEIKKKPNSELTLAEAYARYIDDRSEVLSPSTIRGYRAMERRDFVTLMSLKLKDITPEMIQATINDMASTHSPKSVRNSHSLLSSVLKSYIPAMRLDTRLPQKEIKNLEIPSDSEVSALLQATVGKPIHTAILLGAVGTLRRSEVCALLKSDIKDNGIMVDKAMVPNDKKEYVIKSTKTAAGTRFVELPGFVLDELRAINNTSDRVYPFSPMTLSNGFARTTLQVLGKKYRFHDLRHYSASVLHAMGVPDLYIMQRGGWEDRETLNRVYQHVMSDEQKRYNEKIMNRFSSTFEEMQHEMQHGD